MYWHGNRLLTMCSGVCPCGLPCYNAILPSACQIARGDHGWHHGSCLCHSSMRGPPGMRSFARSRCQPVWRPALMTVISTPPDRSSKADVESTHSAQMILAGSMAHASIHACLPMLTHRSSCPAQVRSLQACSHCGTHQHTAHLQGRGPSGCP